MQLKDVGTIVDKAKVLAIAGVFAFFFGIAGAFTLAAAMASALAMWLSWPAALGITAGTFIAIAGMALWLGLKPSSHAKQQAVTPEEEKAVESAFGSLTDLPLDMARKIISERPIAALAMFSGFGVLIARRPEIAIRLVERLIARFT